MKMLRLKCSISFPPLFSLSFPIQPSKHNFWFDIDFLPPPRKSLGSTTTVMLEKIFYYGNFLMLLKWLLFHEIDTFFKFFFFFYHKGEKIEKRERFFSFERLIISLKSLWHFPSFKAITMAFIKEWNLRGSSKFFRNVSKAVCCERKIQLFFFVVIFYPTLIAVMTKTFNNGFKRIF